MALTTLGAFWLLFSLLYTHWKTGIPNTLFASQDWYNNMPCGHCTRLYTQVSRFYSEAICGLTSLCIGVLSSMYSQESLYNIWETIQYKRRYYIIIYTFPFQFVFCNSSSLSAWYTVIHVIMVVLWCHMGQQALIINFLTQKNIIWKSVKKLEPNMYNFPNQKIFNHS